MNFNELYEYIAIDTFGKDYEYLASFQRRAEIIKDITTKLFDLNMNCVAPLNETGTYVLRLHFGILTGNCESLRSIGKKISKTPERVRQILTRGKETISMYIKNKNISEYKNPSTIELSEKQQSLENMPLGELGLTNRTLMTFAKVGIGYLSELLSYAKSDLLSLEISETVLKEVSKPIADMNLKFIDDLTEEERLKLTISYPNKQNLRASFLIHNNELEPYRNLYKYYTRLDTIGDVLKFITSTNETISKELLYDLESLGIFVPLYKKVDTYLANFDSIDIKTQKLLELQLPLDALLTIKLYSLGFKKRLVNPLSENHHYLTTIGDIIKFKRKDLPLITGLGKKNATDLINIIHGLNLFFPDEIEILKIYSEKIEEQLSSEKDITLKRIPQNK